MPVNVVVALLTAEGQDIDALGGEFCPQGFPNAVDESLKTQVLLGREASRHVFPVLSGRDQGVANGLHKFSSFPVGSAGEEDHGEIVLIERVMWVIWMAAHESTDEARTVAGSFDVGFKVIGLTGAHNRP